MFYKWQMLLPLGVWKMLNHINCMLQHVIFADVITKWQMVWPLQGGFKYQLVDVITKWQMEQP